MPFDGVEAPARTESLQRVDIQFDGMTRLDRLVHLRRLLIHQTDRHQLSFSTCLWRAAYDDATFRGEPDHFSSQPRNDSSHAFMLFFKIDACAAATLVSDLGVSVKQYVLDELIKQERAKGSVLSDRYRHVPINPPQMTFMRRLAMMLIARTA